MAHFQLSFLFAPVFKFTRAVLFHTAFTRHMSGLVYVRATVAIVALSLTISVASAQSDFATKFDTNESISPDFISLIFGPPLDAEHNGPVEMNLSDETLEDELSGIRLADNMAVKNSKKTLKLTPEQLQRQSRIARCLSMYFRMPVVAEKWRPWTIMHGLLPYGQLSRVESKGQHYYAVDYLCHNQIGNDTQMLHLSGSKLGVSVGPGVQGHEGQFLAMLAQADVPITHPIYIHGKKFTVEDLIEYEKRGCKQFTELTFKLIGLSHYVSADEIWKSKVGQSWNIERLIHEEIRQPINGAACGGTHRLMGLSYAIKMRADSGKPVDGEWARAKKYIGQYQDFALQFQNSDGSFSTNWFVTQEAESDLKKRLYTTGHIVEWLAFSLPDEKLHDPKFTRAVDYLVELMLTAPSLDLEIGPKGHAIHALRLYEQRVFGANSNVEEITPADLAIVEKAMIQQKHMKPEFESPTAQPVSFPGSGTPGIRRSFRRR